MDIRNFFGKAGSKKPETKKNDKKEKSKQLNGKKRPRNNFLEDSDDENVNSKNITAPKEKKIKKEKKIDVKDISPGDFFTKSITPKKHPKKSESITKNDSTKKIKKEKSVQESKIKPVEKKKEKPVEIKKEKPAAIYNMSDSDEDLVWGSSTKTASLASKLAAKASQQKEVESKKLNKVKVKMEKESNSKISSKKLDTSSPNKSLEKIEIQTTKVKNETPEKKIKKNKNKSSANQKSGDGVDQKKKLSHTEKTPQKPSENKKEPPKTPKTPTSAKKTKNVIPKTPEELDAAAAAKKERFLKFKQYRDKLASGPSNPGCKEVPEGKPNCLEGITFVVTGIQESLGRDEIKELIERYGGRMTSAVSGRTTYLITGDEPGASKTNKAEKLGTKIITEDEFLELIGTLPGKKSKYDVVQSKTPTKKVATKKVKQEVKKEVEPEKVEEPEEMETDEVDRKNLKMKAVKMVKQENGVDNSLMWVDKYKPTAIKDIIGQQGPQSNMNKLITWLRNWHYNNTDPVGRSKPKPKPNMWGKGDPQGVSFKAALLSGPPGLGKTTTATLVCQELGWSYIELNASDKRSKKSLQGEVSGYLSSQSLDNVFSKNKKLTSNKHVLLMDEVDGMAGNEDRGGMQELIQLIKTTKIPIICMCNDRSSPKMRTFVNYCFDLRFQRPRVQQILSPMMSVCFKEGLKMDRAAVQRLVQDCNQDVRQVLHNLSLIRKKATTFSYDDVKNHSNHAGKDLNLGLFDIAKQILSPDKKQTIVDKLNLFFMDYSMIPNFVQENYLSVNPSILNGNKHDELMKLKLKSKAADFMQIGDTLESTMRKYQSWSLLPTSGLMSTVLPCSVNSGRMFGRIEFPAFMGKLSTTGKNRRLLSEIKFHSSVSTGGASERSFNLDYLTYLKQQIMSPLLEQSSSGEQLVENCTKLLNDYDLLKDDFDSILQLTSYSGVNPYTQVDSKVKSAFTRNFNKGAHNLPYQQQIGGKKQSKRNATNNTGFEEGLMGETDPVNQVSEEEEEDLKSITKKKKTKSVAKKRAGTEKKSTKETKKKRKK